MKIIRIEKYKIFLFYENMLDFGIISSHPELIWKWLMPTLVCPSNRSVFISPLVVTYRQRLLMCHSWGLLLFLYQQKWSWVNPLHWFFMALVYLTAGNWLESGCPSLLTNTGKWKPDPEDQTHNLCLISITLTLASPIKWHVPVRQRQSTTWFYIKSVQRS